MSWEKRMQELGDEEAFRNKLANPAMKIMHGDFDEYVRALLRKPSTS
jgi:hypothetical protein